VRGIPKDELDKRIKTLQGLLQKKEIDGALIMQNADLYYFTGTIQRSYLFIPSQGEPILMVEKSMDRAKMQSALENIIQVESPKNIPYVLKSFGYNKLKNLGFEADVLPTSQYWRFQKLFIDTELIDISILIRSIRMIKSPLELENIKKAAKMAEEVFAFVQETIREGISELELAGVIEKFSRERGHQGFVRTRGYNQEFGCVLLLSGENGAVTSYGNSPLGGRGASNAFTCGVSPRKIRRNESIILDYLPCINGYMVDITRTFCIGTLPNHLVRAYNTALEIQEIVKNIARPGVKCEELYHTAQQIVLENGLGENFMGLEKKVPFIGHGVGLEVDELPVIAPRSDIPLEKNMVLALEPKFVFPDGAVGIENTFVVTESGLSNLMNFAEGIQYL